jgi:tetratricopeptide (TPR) repeat protein
MNTFSTRRWIIAAGLAAALALVPACSPNKAREEAVNAANERYYAMRSALMLDMARQQFETGDLDLAERTVRDASIVDPRNPRIHVMAGRIAMEKGRLERSFHFFAAAIELDEDHAEAHYYQGVVLQRWQRHGEAMERYQRAYEIHPDNVSYLLASAEMLVALDEVERAVLMLEEKLSYFDQNATIRVALAHLNAMQGRHDQSMHYFHQAMLLDPENPKLQEHLALSQIAAGRYDAAITSLERLLADASMRDRRDLRRALAEAYLRTERLPLARQTYLELARSPDGNARDWVRLGELAMRDGDLYGALEASNQAIRREPLHHEGYLLAGMVWQRRDRLDEALRMFDRAAELSPGDAAPLILRGIALERAGRRAAAAEAYAQALTRQPDDERAQRLLSNVQ